VITIKELAMELGVCKQAVYNRITREPLKTKLAKMGCKPQISESGTIYLCDKTVETIRKAYAEKYTRPDKTLALRGYGRLRARKNPSNDELKFLLGHIDDIQAVVSKIVELDNLQNTLNQKNVELAKLSGVVNTLNDIVAKKDDQLNRLHERYVEAASNIRLFQAQVASLKRQITPNELDVVHLPNQNLV